MPKKLLHCVVLRHLMELKAALLPLILAHLSQCYLLKLSAVVGYFTIHDVGLKLDSDVAKFVEVGK